MLRMGLMRWPCIAWPGGHASGLAPSGPIEHSPSSLHWDNDVWEGVSRGDELYICSGDNSWGGVGASAGFISSIQALVTRSGTDLIILSCELMRQPAQDWIQRVGSLWLVGAMRGHGQLRHVSSSRWRRPALGRIGAWADEAHGRREKTGGELRTNHETHAEALAICRDWLHQLHGVVRETWAWDELWSGDCSDRGGSQSHGISGGLWRLDSGLHSDRSVWRCSRQISPAGERTVSGER